jgi:hypothetical protein
MSPIRAKEKRENAQQRQREADRDWRKPLEITIYAQPAKAINAGRRLPGSGMRDYVRGR